MFNEACELGTLDQRYDNWAGLGAGTVTSPNGTQVEATLGANCQANFSSLCSRPTLLARCQRAGYSTPDCSGSGGGGGGGSTGTGVCPPGTIQSIQGCIPMGANPNPGSNPGGGGTGTTTYLCPDGVTQVSNPANCPAPTSQTTTTTSTTATSSAGIPSSIAGIPTLYIVLFIGAYLLLKKR